MQKVNYINANNAIRGLGMKTKIELKAECFDDFVSAAKECTADTEVGRSMIASAMALNTMLKAKEDVNKKNDMRSKHD